MSQELLEYKSLSQQAINQAKQQKDVGEITCLVPKGEDDASKLLGDNGFKYIGKRLIDGEKVIVFKWFRDLKPGYEDMAGFFDRRASDYDEHMRDYETYNHDLAELASYVQETQNEIAILDLGCGTGAELEYVFHKAPNAVVDCVDMSRGMLEKLKENYADKNVNIICVSYTEIDLGIEKYDYVLACNTLHHLMREDKQELYKNIKATLKKGGMFLVSDYVVSDEEEKACLEKYLELVKSGELDKDKSYHIDLTLSERSERELLDSAGFVGYDFIRSGKDATRIIAKK